LVRVAADSTRTRPSEAPGEPDVSTHQLLRQGAQALWEVGDLHIAQSCFESAYRRAERESDPQGMAEAAVGLTGLGVYDYHSYVQATVVRDRVRRAAAAVVPDSPLGLRLRARLAAESDFRRGEHGRILALAERALPADDPIPAAEALNLVHHCLLGPGHGRLRRRIADDLTAAAARTRRRGDRLLGMLWRGVDLVLDGDPDAPRCLARLRALPEARDHRAVDCAVQAIDVMFDIRAGRFEHAERAARRCAEAGAAAGQPGAGARYAAHLLAVRWYQGRVAEMLPTLDATAAAPSLSPTDHSFQAALALACASAGQHRRAQAVLAGLTRRGLRDLPRSGTWLATMYWTVEAAHALGDARTAAEAYDLLLPYARLPVTAGPGIVCLGVAEHALGLAKLTVGEVSAAGEHLRRAVRDNQAIGHLPAAALAGHRQAAALAGPARSAASTEALAARREAARLGMRLPDSSARPASPGPAPISCRRRQGYWWLEVAGRHAVVRHSRGLAHLAVLLANPGQEIPALDLASGPSDTRRTAGIAAQPLLDENAIRQYQRRLQELERQVETDGRARAERDWLRGQLRSAAGLAGRPRAFATDDERARIAVGKAIRRALGRIADADPELGRVLAASVHTGQRCAYVPAGPEAAAGS